MGLLVPCRLWYINIQTGLRKDRKMKHKEYAAGVLTGVLVVALAAGGVKFVQQRQYNGVLSDSSHVQKIEYLEKMIDQEYLGEVDNAEMAEGIYAGLSTVLAMSIPDIIQQMNMHRRQLRRMVLMQVSVFPSRKIKMAECRSQSAMKAVPGRKPGCRRAM